MTSPAASEIAFATIAAASYRPSAEVLARSLARFHPEVPIYLLDPETSPATVDAGLADAVRPLALESLGLADLPSWRFRYTRRQLAVAMKPRLIVHLLDRGFARVVFLDADLWALAPLAPLLAAAERHPLVLSPHRLSPARGADAVAAELAIARSGVHNLGVLAVAEAPETRRFLAWWSERLERHCLLEPARGLHHDQGWVDLAPGRVAGAHLLRDPGTNVGHWNLDERPLERREGALLAGGVPCRLFHFSGFDPLEPERLSRHSRRASSPAVRELAAAYARELLAAGWREAQAREYAWGRFADGRPVPDEARRLYLDRGEELATLGDPFSREGGARLLDWFAAPGATTATSSREAAIPRLWLEVWRQRTDLREAFPAPLAADRAAFLAWVGASGPREHPAVAALVAPPAPPR